MTSSENKKGAKYHFLALFIFIIPLIGFLVPVLVYAFTGPKSIDQRNQFRALMNLFLSLFIYGLVMGLLLPPSVLQVCNVILALMVVPMMIMSGLRARKGYDVEYPLVIPFCRPLRNVPTMTPEEMMHSHS